MPINGKRNNNSNPMTFLWCEDYNGGGCEKPNRKYGQFSISDMRNHVKNISAY